MKTPIIDGYKLIAKASLYQQELVDEVNRAITDGWQPLGHPGIYEGAYGAYVIVQAMVHYQEQPA